MCCKIIGVVAYIFAGLKMIQSQPIHRGLEQTPNSQMSKFDTFLDTMGTGTDNTILLNVKPYTAIIGLSTWLHLIGTGIANDSF